MDVVGDFQFGRWLARPSLNQLSSSEQVKHLRPRTMDVLVHLAVVAPLVVSRDDLLRAVWPDRHIEDEGLTHCVAELREALGEHVPHGDACLEPPLPDARPPLIETIAKRGYRLNAAVRWSRVPVDPANHTSGLVVLPFDDLGPDRDECFREGLMEAFISALAEIPGLRVVSRTSTLQLGGGLDLCAVAAKLRVSHAVEGAIRRAGGRTVLTVRLLDASGDAQLWSQTFTDDGGDSLEAQQRAAHAVAAAVQPLLMGGQDQH